MARERDGDQAMGEVSPGGTEGGDEGNDMTGQIIFWRFPPSLPTRTSQEKYLEISTLPALYSSKWVSFLFTSSSKPKMREISIAPITMPMIRAPKNVDKVILL